VRSVILVLLVGGKEKPGINVGCEGLLAFGLTGAGFKVVADGN